MSRYWIVAVALFTTVPPAAAAPDCGSVLTDTARPLSQRRDLARECLVIACREEAQDLRLAPDATDRFMKMCVVDQSAQVLAGEPAGETTGGPASTGDIACASGARCKDPSADFEATAAGMSAGGRPTSGHSFVRVQRITETLER